MLDLSAALATAVEAVAVARELLLEECARPDGPRGEIGHCPADDEAEWIIRQHLLGAFPTWGFLGEETGLLVRMDNTITVPSVSASNASYTTSR